HPRFSSFIHPALIPPPAQTHASDTTEIKAVGGSVTFHSNNTDTQPALWNFGNIPIVTVLFKGSSEPLFYEDKFKTRFTVSEDGRALSISQLRMEDAGTYSVTIAGKISTFILLVYKELTEPTVTCESQNCSDGRCLISLRCSVPGTSFGNVSYTWRVRDWQWERQSLEITVNKSSQGQSEPLTCTARNAVSSRNVTVTSPEGLCSGESRGKVGIWGKSGICSSDGMEMLGLGWADPAPQRTRKMCREKWVWLIPIS
uniref:Ig-like domain-containing protein n=1 Tax=Zosterops lateralis melanops TaxID=1220523 RepID=A0A8D2PW93_ZOSLA